MNVLQFAILISFVMAYCVIAAVILTRLVALTGLVSGTRDHANSEREQVLIQRSDVPDA